MSSFTQHTSIFLLIPHKMCKFSLPFLMEYMDPSEKNLHQFTVPVAQNTRMSPLLCIVHHTFKPKYN